MTLAPRLLASGAALLVLLPAVTWFELRSASIPDLLSIATLLIAGALAFVDRGTPEASLAIGALVGGSVPLLARRLTEGGVGWGDVKLSVGLGALLGPVLWGVAALAASLAAAGGIALDRLVSRDASSCEAGVPFGPYLVAGGVMTLVMEMSRG